ncbi:MAG: hypothetical protein SFY32_12530 [Bacteroidota bacterium]|nr:hypothetical protein [Bacteroidota bacterium]
MVKYTNQFLNKLEDIFAESEFILRYEKGNFKSGYCILKEQRIIIVNKYYTLEGKINCLIDILRGLPMEMAKFKDKTRDFYLEITQTQLSF